MQCRRSGFDPWVRKIPWRSKWQSSPVFLPGGFHGQRSLAGFSPWGHKESEMTNTHKLRLHFHSLWKEPSPCLLSPKATFVWNHWDCLTCVLLPLDTELLAGNAAHFLHPLQHISPGLFLTTQDTRGEFRTELTGDH